MHNDEHQRRFDNVKWQANPLIKMKITEDDPRRNVENIVKRAKRAAQPLSDNEKLRRYFESPNYKPSNGKGVGY